MRWPTYREYSAISSLRRGDHHRVAQSALV
jgi:hypothetical protein